MVETNRKQQKKRYNNQIRRLPYQTPKIGNRIKQQNNDGLLLISLSSLSNEYY